MSRLGQVVAKTLAVLVALFFLLGAIVTAAPGLFGGSKVKTLFGASEDALAGGAPAVKKIAANPVPDAGAPVRDPLFMHATKAGPMPVPRPAPVDAGKPAEPKPARPPVYFPASKSAGGLGLPEQAPQPNPAQQAQP